MGDMVVIVIFIFWNCRKFMFLMFLWCEDNFYFMSMLKEKMFILIFGW